VNHLQGDHVGDLRVLGVSPPESLQPLKHQHVGGGLSLRRPVDVIQLLRNGKGNNVQNAPELGGLVDSDGVGS